MLYLIAGVFIEALGTSLLQASHGFTRLWPSLGALACIGGGIFCWSMSLKSMDIGASYALWSGSGIILTGLAGWIFFRQQPDLPAVAGFILIIAGVVVIDVFSKTVRD
jgi:small multidrug resistance pump